LKITLIKTSAGLIPATSEDAKILNAIGDGELVEYDVKTEQRTDKQNNSIHLYCQLLADALNNAGLDVQKTLDMSLSIGWTKVLVKMFIWAKVQKAMYGTTSTTELDTKQVSAVYDTINRYLSDSKGVSVAFPNRFN